MECPKKSNLFPAENQNCSNLNESQEAVSSRFMELYKCRPVLTQVQRREDLLIDIKLRRSNAVDEKRGITDLFTEDEDESFQEIEEELMDTEIKLVKRQKRTFHKYKIRLMLSEWFVQIPDDLEQNWLVKLCPVGIRTFVVANQNTTKAYNRYGEQTSQFISAFPGGGPATPKNIFTVLDCIYNRKSQCYYILDVIAWNCMSLLNCDTDFRFFWLKSKCMETPELRSKSKRNKYCFYDVDFMPAELPLIEDRLSQPYDVFDGEVALDGILFYHRQIDYTAGITPLVGWLKPFMISELLNVPVHPNYMQEKPAKYTTLVDHVEYSQKLANRTRKPRWKHANIEKPCAIEDDDLKDMDVENLEQHNSLEAAGKKNREPKCLRENMETENIIT